MTIFFKIVFLSLAIVINHIHGLVPSEEIGGKHYSFHNSRKRQHDASSACRNEGGKLYEPMDRPTYDKIVEFAKQYIKDDFWLGINDASFEGKFVYQSENSPLLWNDTEKEYWAPGHPKNYGQKEDCVVGSRKYNYKWCNQACTYTAYYVCEKNGQCKEKNLKNFSYNFLQF